MFRREVKKIDGLLSHFLRAGQMVANYTSNVFISNQTLMVKIDNSALRAELSMMRTQLANRLNQHVGAFVISDIKFY